MRKLTIAAALAFLLSACTPAQGEFWKSWFASNPKEAKAAWEDYRSTVRYDDPPDAAVPAVAPMGSKCPEWFDEAMDAGWSYSQWRRIDHIIWRESRCTPGVVNSIGATGLMQIMPIWRQPCGMSRAMLQNGRNNLTCALHILHTQGWEAWSTA